MSSAATVTPVPLVSQHGRWAEGVASTDLPSSLVLDGFTELGREGSASGGTVFGDPGIVPTTNYTLLPLPHHQKSGQFGASSSFAEHVTMNLGSASRNIMLAGRQLYQTSGPLNVSGGVASTFGSIAGNALLAEPQVVHSVGNSVVAGPTVGALGVVTGDVMLIGPQVYQYLGLSTIANEPSGIIGTFNWDTLLAEPAASPNSGAPDSEPRASVDESSPWLDEVQRRINRYAKFISNWDSYGAKPISVHAVRKALRVSERLASMISRTGLPLTDPPFVAPTSVGGILFEIRNRGRELQIGIGPEDSDIYEVYRFSESDREAGVEESLSESSLPEVLSWIVDDSRNCTIV